MLGGETHTAIACVVYDTELLQESKQVFRMQTDTELCFLFKLSQDERHYAKYTWHMNVCGIDFFFLS